MSKIEDLKRELAELEAKEKEDQEIKDLQDKIQAKKFSKTTGGKVFNKIADVGEGLGKAIFQGKGSGATPKKKKKFKSIQEVMRDLPQ